MVVKEKLKRNYVRSGEQSTVKTQPDGMVPETVSADSAIAGEEKENRENIMRIIEENETGKDSDLVKDNYLISEAARLVKVESHVLRYWEEELKLPIRRNELGHRYYTKEDVQQFREIRHMKEQGLQLRAIRTILTDSDMQVIVPLKEKSVSEKNKENDKHVSQETVPTAVVSEKSVPDKVSREEVRVQEPASDKGFRLQMLLHNLVSQAVRDNNRELSEEIRQTVLKELDYQFRLQEEMEEKREQERIVREEEHFRNLDEMLRQYTGRSGKREEKAVKTEKRKKHSIF